MKNLTKKQLSAIDKYIKNIPECYSRLKMVLVDRDTTIPFLINGTSLIVFRHHQISPDTTEQPDFIITDLAGMTPENASLRPLSEIDVLSLNNLYNIPRAQHFTPTRLCERNFDYDVLKPVIDIFGGKPAIKHLFVGYTSKRYLTLATDDILAVVLHLRGDK